MIEALASMLRYSITEGDSMLLSAENQACTKLFDASESKI